MLAIYRLQKFQKVVQLVSALYMTREAVAEIYNFPANYTLHLYLKNTFSFHIQINGTFLEIVINNKIYTNTVHSETIRGIQNFSANPAKSTELIFVK